jgi:hypothetical protein
MSVGQLASESLEMLFFACMRMGDVTLLRAKKLILPTRDIAVTMSHFLPQHAKKGRPSAKMGHSKMG